MYWLISIQCIIVGYMLGQGRDYRDTEIASPWGVDMKWLPVRHGLV